MKIFSIIRTKIGALLVDLIRARHGVVTFYGDMARRADLNLIHKVRQERKLLLSDQEAYQVMMFARRTSKIPGDIAEVGAYKGASAKLIAHAAPGRSIHLFDTFEGLPPLQDIDRSAFKDGQYPADLADVTKYLSSFPQVTLYKGLFPKTAGPITAKKFSFVHLDVDLYQSTKDALEFFFPRMSKGGVIISHDYMTAEGVRKAVDDFMKDKPEAVFESAWRQCFIVKG